MTTNEEGQRLSQAIRKEYGTDVIIVYKPEGQDYFVTTSINSPVCTQRIMQSVVARMSIHDCASCGAGPCKMLGSTDG